MFMGAVGPFISPFVELYNCISAGDDFNTTLADVTGAFFNGADLNLDSLLPTINDLIGSEFPPGMTMAELDIAFGGLLSTGSVQIANYVSGDTDVPAVGGSIFNSVGLEFTGVPQEGTLTLTSEPIGPIGAWEDDVADHQRAAGFGLVRPYCGRRLGRGSRIRRECEPPHRSRCDGAGDRDRIPDPAH